MITTLTGPNDYLWREELTKLVKNFSDQYGEMSVEKIDCEDSEWAKVKESLDGLPFLTARKLVVLREPSKLKEFLENITQVLENLSETNDLIIVEPKLDKRLAYYKTLKTKTDFKEFEELNFEGAVKWLMSESNNKQGSLSRQDAELIVDRVGLNQSRLANELNKLLTHNKQINLKDINELVDPTAQSTIFNLIDAAFKQDTKQMLRLYDEQRALKVEPQQIIALLAWQFHVMSLIKFADSNSPSLIAKRAKLNPYVVNKNFHLVNKLSKNQIKVMVSNLLDIDIQLKTKNVDSDEALKLFLLSVSQTIS